MVNARAYLAGVHQEMVNSPNLCVRFWISTLLRRGKSKKYLMAPPVEIQSLPPLKVRVARLELEQISSFPDGR